MGPKKVSGTDHRGQNSQLKFFEEENGFLRNRTMCPAAVLGQHMAEDQKQTVNNPRYVKKENVGLLKVKKFVLIPGGDSDAA